MDMKADTLARNSKADMEAATEANAKVNMEVDTEADTKVNMEADTEADTKVNMEAERTLKRTRKCTWELADTPPHPPSFYHPKGGPIGCYCCWCVLLLLQLNSWLSLVLFPLVVASLLLMLLSLPRVVVSVVIDVVVFVCCGCRLAVIIVASVIVTAIVVAVVVAVNVHVIVDVVVDDVVDVIIVDGVVAVVDPILLLFFFVFVF